MAESAMMTKCLSNSVLCSLEFKFSQGYSKAVDHVQMMSHSPEYSILKTERDPGDKPTTFALDDQHTRNTKLHI